MKDSYEKLQELFADALVDASENFRNAETQKNTTNGGVNRVLEKGRSHRADAQKKITAEYQADVDDILNMRSTKKDSLIMGYTPDVYVGLGMPSIPFVIGTGHVYSIAKTEAEAKADKNYHKGTNYHGAGDVAVKDLYKSLQDPVMIIAAKDVKPNATPLRSTHSVVAIIDVKKGNTSLLLPIEITAEREVNGVRMDVNVLSSAYERSVASLVADAIAQENAGEVGVYFAKKEAMTLPRAGVPFPIPIQQSIASNGIVHYFGEKVKRKISKATQSQQFARWFGDWQNDPANASKVVNADGTPKVMYHGTRAVFTIFDRSKSTKRVSLNTFGEGYYFTSDYARAESYAKGGTVMEDYLVVKNPYYANTRGGGFTREIENTFGLAPNSISRKDISDILKKHGYDGVIVRSNLTYGEPETVVVFEPTQIKSATDNIGTFDDSNPDTLFSTRKTGTSAKTQADAFEQFHRAMNSVVNPGAKAMDGNEILTDGAVVTDGNGKMYSLRSMKHDIAEGKMFVRLAKQA